MSSNDRVNIVSQSNGYYTDKSVLQMKLLEMRNVTLENPQNHRAIL